jgi:outer membrane protein OmpA-like peptidoglycan-associated protein
MKHRFRLSLLLAAAWLVGCSTARPPTELVDARAAYAKAAQGKSPQYDPAGLHEAQLALKKAEASYSKDPNGEVTRDQAYVALRRAERSEVAASVFLWQQREKNARDAAVQAQAKGLESTQVELARTRQQLEQEKAARTAAEAGSKESMARLSAAHAAAVKQEDRGTVITLAGGVLFATNKAALLPGAEQSLEQVAQAISTDNTKRLLVEGHTDSRGSDAKNKSLSKARAESVAKFLKSHGVAPERITTEGLGSSQPIADNATVEGRATNRRVEIVIEPDQPTP